MKIRAFPHLLLILSVIWLLVLFGAVLIFHFIVPFAYFHNFADSIMKGFFTLILVLVWLYIFAFLTNSFVRVHITRTR